MAAYPVHYQVEPPARFSRVQLAARIIAFIAIGMLGLSFGAVFAFAYLALPVFAASRLSARAAPDAYVTEDGPRVVAALRWLAAVSAWAGLIAEHLPGRSPDELVRIEIEGTPRPTASSALWRVVSGLPSALVLAVLGWLGAFVWLWAALSILITERIGSGALRYLIGLQRWSVRLLAYQASLVDEYPPFSFAEAPGSALPAAHATR